MNMHAERLDAVRARINAAARACGRNPSEVQLLAVSKQHSAAAVRTLHELGVRSFGENRLDEALHKQAELQDLDLDWHFIGPLQSNKTRDVAAHFGWVQSVDRAKTLKRLAQQRPAALPALNICLQINIDDEPQKSGAPAAQAAELAALAAQLPRLRLRGLMCLPSLTDDKVRTRASFARLADLAQQLGDQGHALDTLSMGMSGDLELAVAEGSTMVRIGTDLFGPRTGTAAP